MGIASFFTFLLLITFVLTEDPLKFALIILRHGARAARANIAELSNRVSWPEGKNSLTASGKRQLHLLGKMMHQYFVDELKLMPNSYDPKTLLVRSSDATRTIMSVNSFLLGLYPNLQTMLSPEQLANEKIWTPPGNFTLPDYVKKSLGNSAVPFNVPPIPILNYLVKTDRLLSFESCERFYNDRMEFYKSPSFIEVYKAFNESFQKACDIVRIDCKHLTGRPVWEHTDALVTAEFDGQLPELSEHPDLVEELEKFYTAMEHGELTLEPKLQTPVAMHQFSTIIPGYLENVIKDPSSPQKMVVLSTHESTMLSYLIALNVNDKSIYETVPYASNIMIELRLKAGAKEGDIDSYYVNMTFNSKPLMELKPFKEFKEWLAKKGVLPGEWEKICKIPTTAAPEPADNDLVGIYVVAAEILCLVILLCAITYFYRKTDEPVRNDEIPDTLTTV